MEIRKITVAEREEILTGDIYAYHSQSHWQPDPSGKDLDSIVPDQSLAVFIDGKIASSLRNYDFQQSVRGVIKEMGGIGGVWTYPEYRDRGYVRELLKAAFQDMQTKSQSVSMLIPFKQSFYAKFGYVTANANLEVRIPTQSLITLKNENAGAWEFQRIKATEVKAELLEFMRLVALPHHGITLPTDMRRSQWEPITSDQQAVLVKKHNQLVALAIYRIDARPSERKIYMHNFYWLDLEARIQLFSFFGKHRDQINYVYLDLPFGTNFNQWFGDVMEPYEVNIPIPPYMVRVVDIEKAIALLPAEKPGTINMKVTDLDCEWNNDIFTLESEAKKLNVRRNSKVKPDIKVTIQGISALVYGTLTLAEIEYKKWLEDAKSDEVRSLLENWFCLKSIYNTFRF